MTLAAIPWLSISINLLLVVFVIVCLLMTLLILMQRPKQEGLGAAFGGGVTDQVFGARTTNVLQRGTVYLGSLFFLISLTLAVLIGHQNKKTSIVSKAKAKVEATQPAEETKPADDSSLPKSLQDELPAEGTPAGESEIPSPDPAPEGVTPPVEVPPAPAEVPPAPAEVPPAPAEVPPAPAEAAPSAPAETAPEGTTPPAGAPAPAAPDQAGTPQEGAEPAVGGDSAPAEEKPNQP